MNGWYDTYDNSQFITTYIAIKNITTSVLFPQFHTALMCGAPYKIQQEKKKNRMRDIQKDHILILMESLCVSDYDSESQISVYSVHHYINWHIDRVSKEEGRITPSSGTLSSALRQRSWALTQTQHAWSIINTHFSQGWSFMLGISLAQWLSKKHVTHKTVWQSLQLNSQNKVLYVILTVLRHNMFADI